MRVATGWKNGIEFSARHIILNEHCAVCIKPRACGRILIPVRLNDPSHASQPAWVPDVVCRIALVSSTSHACWSRSGRSLATQPARALGPS